MLLAFSSRQQNTQKISKYGVKLQIFLYVLLDSVQFLALLSAPCYHKMAVKETTPSLAFLFLKLAGTTLQILGPELSKK